jgi:TM2 domain-containing membrane protein YozV
MSDNEGWNPEPIVAMHPVEDADADTAFNFIPPPPPNLPATSHYAYPPQVQQPMQVLPKSPGLAVVASFFFPGLGSMISGRGGKGAAILISYLVSWFLISVLIGIPLVIFFWIYGMVAGSNDAKKWNAAHGIIS